MKNNKGITLIALVITINSNANISGSNSKCCHKWKTI